VKTRKSQGTTSEQVKDKTTVNKSQVKGVGQSQGINNKQVKDNNRDDIRKSSQVKPKKSRERKCATKAKSRTRKRVKRRKVKEKGPKGQGKAIQSTWKIEESRGVLGQRGRQESQGKSRETKSREVKHSQDKSRQGESREGKRNQVKTRIRKAQVKSQVKSKQVKGIDTRRKVKEDKDKERATSKSSKVKRKDGKGQRHKESIRTHYLNPPFYPRMEGATSRYGNRDGATSPKLPGASLFSAMFDQARATSKTFGTTCSQIAWRQPIVSYAHCHTGEILTPSGAAC
jgi:hypothetical protein